MRVLVPFDAATPKSRLSSLFDDGERRALAAAMLADTLAALKKHDPLVLATAPIEVDAPVVVDDRPLTEAVNGALAGALPTAVVMADLPLATPAAIKRLVAPDVDVAVAPGLGGGTNAIVVRDPAFTVDYHGASVRDHRRIAREAGLSTATVDSFRLAVDVDEPTDLAEVLLHGDGTAAEWLRDCGRIESTDGRVQFIRTTE